MYIPYLQTDFHQSISYCANNRGSRHSCKNTTTTKENVVVDYILKVNKDSNILSKFGNLDNTDKNRIITVNTLKQGSKLTLQHYEYAINNAKKIVILSGNGLFEKLKDILNRLI